MLIHCIFFLLVYCFCCFFFIIIICLPNYSKHGLGIFFIRSERLKLHFFKHNALRKQQPHQQDFKQPFKFFCKKTVRRQDASSKLHTDISPAPEKIYNEVIQTFKTPCTPGLNSFRELPQVWINICWSTPV